ncbi:MAG TPA: hypothetical protein VKB58_09300 [Terriglobales bacterium]|nr:hypothetical protein [Terriglobales bacterium]
MQFGASTHGLGSVGGLAYDPVLWMLLQHGGHELAPGWKVIDDNNA